MNKNDFIIEGKVKEWKGNHLITVDKFKGKINNVLPDLHIKYSGKKKKNIFDKLADAFDMAGGDLEKSINKRIVKK